MEYIMKIGFYDSGLGGIKTLKDIINMGLTGDKIMPDTYRDITFAVDAQLLDAGGTIQGELFILNPTISDCTYTIDIAG